MPPIGACSLPGDQITAVSQRDHALTITAHPTKPTARCPRGGERSQRLHRDDTRRPRDLPRWDDAVRLVLQVRRVRGLDAACPAHTFAERVSPMVPPLGLALGGAAGARLGATPDVPTSPATLRRLVRQLPAPSTATPSLRGVDEWTMRRGHTDGPLLVDLERHRPLDRLPDHPARIRVYTGSAVSARRSMRAGPPSGLQTPHRSSTGGLCSAIGGTPSHRCWLGSISAWPPG